MSAVVVERRAVALGALVILLCLGVGCRQGGSPSNARITMKDGIADVIVGEAVRLTLPAADLGHDLAPSLVQDASGRRLAYPTATGVVRILYLVGEGVFLGPLISHPADFRAAPDLDHALGPLFETAGGRRAELVREVRREQGELGVARLLIEAAYVDDPLWEETKKDLTSASIAVLREGLANALEPGKPGLMLRRAVATVDLTRPWRAHLVAARARNPVAAAAAPRAVAALLRAVIARDPSEAAKIGCEILARKPVDDESAVLVEAAVLAIAAADADCPDPTLVEAFVSEWCLPYYRCNDGGPLSWETISRQDEPLCTKAQLATALMTEVARPPSDILAASLATMPRSALFAFAWLAGRDRTTPAFVHAHDRRRYTLNQVGAPACDSDLPAGTPCHCLEPALRFQACREPEAEQTQVDLCRFAIDDRQQTIHDVVRAAGTRRPVW